MTKYKISNDKRIEVAQACAEGRMKKCEAVRQTGVSYETLSEWVARYKASGLSAFDPHDHNKKYTNELKLQAVKEYFEGEKTINEISAKYGLRSKRQLRNWIKLYSDGNEFDIKKLEGNRNKRRQKTTEEERVSIIKDFMESGSSIKDIALKYNVSYQTLYTWIRKYKENGLSGLRDNRLVKTE